MSERKLYLIRSRSDDETYFCGDRMFPNWSDRLTTLFGSYEIAKEIAEEYNGRPAMFVKEPEKEVVSENVGKAIDSLINADTYVQVSAAFQYLFTSRKMKDVKRIMKAVRNGYTVAKEKKYNVKVPHAVNSYFKKIDANYCIAGDTFIVDLDEDLVQFTEAEIKHYGLQDCEKEEVTDDEQ